MPSTHLDLLHAIHTSTHLDLLDRCPKVRDRSLPRPGVRIREDVHRQYGGRPGAEGVDDVGNRERAQASRRGVRARKGVAESPLRKGRKGQVTREASVKI